MNRRNFINSVGTSVIGVLAASAYAKGSAEDIDARRIPRWRGFNLQGWFGTPEKPNTGQAFDEFDFATMAEWDFNFARLPLSYWTWGKKDDWSYIDENVLKKIDYAVDLGRQYNIHVNINFHRIPGYCINDRELETADLFSGTKAQRDKALAAAAFHWETFAKRYKGIPNE